MLRFDDHRKLAQIGAIFVTVEPNGGSKKPTGKPFLFAMLRKEANHPERRIDPRRYALPVNTQLPNQFKSVYFLLFGTAPLPIVVFAMRRPLMTRSTKADV
jgi:hypothetical protein